MTDTLIGDQRLPKECPTTTRCKPYKSYPEAFKLEALRLLEVSDRPASEVARQLGIRRNHLYKLKEQMSQAARGLMLLRLLALGFSGKWKLSKAH